MAGPDTSVQFTTEAASIEQDSKLAIFFDDGEGYLYVREMGVGTQTRAILVHSVADGKLYVRKISHPHLQQLTTLHRHRALGNICSNRPKCRYTDHISIFPD
jgi:hypothetical protein